MVHFQSSYVENLDEYLTPDQLKFMRSDLAPMPTEQNPNAVPDPLVQYKGPKQGIASWERPYRCANREYKVSLFEFQLTNSDTCNNIKAS